MKMKSFRYLVGEGIKSTWANRLMTIASIGVLVACMILIGFALLISENANLAVGAVEKQNVVMVYMKDYSWAIYGDHEEFELKEDSDENGISPSDYVIHDEDEAKELCKKIRKISNVNTVKFVSGDKALEELMKEMTDDQVQYFSFLKEENGNPLSGAARVTMNDMSKFDETVKKIEKLEGVDTIRQNKELAGKINGIKRGMVVLGIWVIALLLIIALIIVSNTIRVTMYSRKLQISIMKAVGANNSFIRLPFVIEGIIIGLVSAVVSEGVLFFVYQLGAEKIMERINVKQIVPFGDMAWELLLVFAVIGVLSGALGSLIVIRKYLRREGSEFTAI